MSKSASPTLVVGVLVTAMLLGCSQSRPLSTEQVEQLIKTKVGAELTPKGLVISSVACPENLTMKRGDNFECTAQFEGGGSIAVQVQQKDDEGNLDFTARQKLVLAAKVEAGIAAQLKGQGTAVTVACSQRAYPATPNSTFPCIARSADGQQVVFEVKVTNEQGDVSWTPKATTPAPD